MRSNRYRFFDPESESVFYCGLDLGQKRDYTAFCAVERRPGSLAIYHVRGLKRFELGMSYPDIVKEVKKAINHPAIKPNLLLIDNTGVGVAVSDLFRKEGLNFYPITITGGENVSRGDRSVRVPKRELVSNLQVLLQTKRLEIAGRLDEAQTLMDELSDFQVKISPTGHDTYGSWREGTHDDLVLALAMACWAAEKKALPKGLIWPRRKTGRRKLHGGRELSGRISSRRVTRPALEFFSKFPGI